MQCYLQASHSPPQLSCVEVSNSMRSMEVQVTHDDVDDIVIQFRRCHQPCNQTCSKSNHCTRNAPPLVRFFPSNTQRDWYYPRTQDNPHECLGARWECFVATSRNYVHITNRVIHQCKKRWDQRYRTQAHKSRPGASYKAIQDQTIKYQPWDVRLSKSALRSRGGSYKSRGNEYLWRKRTNELTLYTSYVNKDETAINSAEHAPVPVGVSFRQ